MSKQAHSKNIKLQYFFFLLTLISMKKINYTLRRKLLIFKFQGDVSILRVNGLKLFILPNSDLSG